MARPLKEGVDYFPLDVRMDSKFELIEAEFGLIGFAVVVKLFQRIYSEFGYYCEWTNEVALLFSKNVGMGGSAVSEIVSASIKRGVFDKTMFDKYSILTSSGIQKRYFEMVARRNIVNVKNEYLLVKFAHDNINANNNRVNVYSNSKNADHNTQSKVKESKGKNNTVDECISMGSVGEQKTSAAEQELIKYFLNNIQATPAKNVIDALCTWTDTFPVNVITKAIDESVAANKRSMSYINGILKSWEDKRLFSLPLVEGHIKAWQESKTKAQPQNKVKSRFNNYQGREWDFEEIERLEREKIIKDVEQRERKELL